MDALYPSPMERSLPLRFLYNMAPLALILLLTLLVGNWFVAGRAARQMLESRMADSASLAAEIIPFFLESGHSLLQQMAEDPNWLSGTPEQDMIRLQQARITVPFFNRMYLLNAIGELVAVYPENSPELSFDEENGIDLGLLGVPVQNYPIPPTTTNENPVVSFIAAIPEQQTGHIKGILIGHADITLNPFTRPILSNLYSMNEFDGDGLLLDNENRVMFHTDQIYLGEVQPLPEGLAQTGLQPNTQQTAQFFDDRSPDGTRRLVYYQPAVGQPWSVILTVPAREAQQLALNIASPMLVMILVVFFLAATVLLLGLRFVTRSLENLAREADRIASGQLDHPLISTSDDEVGRLSRAFEQMRVRLQTRMDELNLLLTVSQGVASSLEISEALKPVLDSALTTGADAARIVLTEAALPEVQDNTPQPTRYGSGSGSQTFRVLDDQILSLIRQQERLVINNLNRVRLIQFPAGAPRPEALLAMALKHENANFGVLWLAYSRPHSFSEDELRFIATLTSQTALAIANTRSFLNAEIGRQRLASILASTPDPVLVTDHQNRLLLANPAAWQILHLRGEANLGQPIDRLIFQPELVNLLKSTSSEKQSTEFTISGTQTYLATASPVLAGGRQVGRICVMRDITHFKELDALKSEFVATVSHDLRSPLTLVRGYATMMEMVGELNEQQSGYVAKIIQGVESMARLVTDLLDLGRIEAGIDLQLEFVDVNDIVEGCVNSIQPQAYQKQIKLETRMDEAGIPPVQADSALLNQALHNLIENAIKYTDSGGKVQVKIRLNPETVSFEVSDTGIGIAPVDQPRLFEKFYRGAQRDTRRRQGTGLGLAIVKSIAERHKGRVWVESQLGKGSTFGFEIPLRQPSR
jgi:PAS domain S-box-containing protein